jgi:hypothetical protein
MSPVSQRWRGLVVTDWKNGLITRATALHIEDLRQRAEDLETQAAEGC